ncbi:serine hydrolase domain-containing protein [Winogradskyella haliclonae]|uniref:Serine hydrolase n=1 Tax=Winogradskyella haliclonae TaxID=2048558 RepID=A0ABQ2C238_9FLAO|nr:serine hydrolase [Winogradskyella haliclonae]GGI58117.1 serine hydrolase [Winogradskyella haliclonae]
MRITYTLLVFIIMLSCSSTESMPQETPNNNTGVYFPPLNSDDWESTSTIELGWNETAKQELLNFLEHSDTEGFIILYEGKIAMENYFNGANAFTNNPWFSAGKTLTAFTLCIAEQEGLINLNNPSSDYLGVGWSSLTSTEEMAIKVRNHVTMTTGLDYTMGLYCTDFDCLTYLDEPNSFWYYHNAPYTLTQSIISGAVNTTFDSYYNSGLKDKIGMQGGWVSLGYNRFYASTARSMARFGLLCYNKGTWDNTEILNEAYFNEMTRTSQNLNPAYGYLWWLNGKSSYILPSSPIAFNGKLIPNAPDDLIAGLGANDQKLYILPSEKLVIIRMGGNGGEGQLGPSGYDNLLWEKINAVID